MLEQVAVKERDERPEGSGDDKSTPYGITEIGGKFDAFFASTHGPKYPFLFNNSVKTDFRTGASELNAERNGSMQVPRMSWQPLGRRRSVRVFSLDAADYARAVQRTKGVAPELPETHAFVAVRLSPFAAGGCCPQTKVRRDWHHHSRALRRRLMGQGGIAGC
ncbi:hypothetical protein [Bradyrhizobium commune]|uniref:Uncharacterized protein n=1 Tax=Bradyrhizobium commune TaxID=83627 RepID=A0A7S9D4R9_9BRAD|nr:hypothetical protein [Bradyrhizobium commune]QPF91175.1 hypothetical protein IC761_32750 [Bradyrhizobium commune]